MRSEVREEASITVVRDTEPFEILRARYVRQQFAPHSHDSLALGVIEQGRSRMLWRGAERLLRAGDVVVIAPGEVHTGGPADDAGWQYRMLYVPTSLVADAAGGEDRAPAAPRFDACVVHDPLLAARLVALHRVLESGDALHGPVMLREAIATLVRQHAAHVPAPAREDHAPAAVRLVCEYLREHYAEPIALAQLAGLVGLSACHLIRVFRRATGLPPYMYLEQVRIEHARAMLRTGMAPSHVAYFTGFSDQSHLTRRFKRVVGVTPGRYARCHAVIGDGARLVA